MIKQDQQDCLQDGGPAGVAATAAQLHKVERFDHPVWRQITRAEPKLQQK